MFGVFIFFIYFWEGKYKENNKFMNKLNDERHLLDLLSHGDKDAFELLFTTYYPKIKQFLSGFVDTPEEGEYLVQNMFVKVWQKRRSFAYVENLSAYLYRITKNTFAKKDITTENTLKKMSGIHFISSFRHPKLTLASFSFP